MGARLPHLQQENDTNSACIKGRLRRIQFPQTAAKYRTTPRTLFKISDSMRRHVCALRGSFGAPWQCMVIVGTLLVSRDGGVMMPMHTLEGHSTRARLRNDESGTFGAQQLRKRRCVGLVRFPLVIMGRIQGIVLPRYVSGLWELYQI